jgi:serine/threonine protein kinase
MDYIPGDDLETMRTWQNRPLPLHDVLHWADQLLDALHYLHTHQPPIIHRDLKPANLKLHGQQMMLLDFGIAKGTVANQSLASARSQFAYTLAYAPLEQIQGTGTTPCSDLYALAGTLYVLLTNQLPTDAVTRASHRLQQTPDPLRPVHTLNPDIPPAVSDVLLHALALDVSQRPASANDMRAALHRAASQRPATGPAVVGCCNRT